MTNETLATMVHVALRILNQRVLAILALMLDAGLFGWAMTSGGWDRFTIAATFALMAWATINVRFPKE